MPMQFLEKVAELIHQKFNGDYTDLSVILPNKRSIVFLNNYLQEKHDKPFWQPDFYSIEEFVSKVSGYKIASNIELIFSLFKVFVDRTNGEGTFEEFNSWGPTVIKDFNDIGMNIGDYKLIFSYLNDVKNLKKWNLDRTDLSDFDKNYLQFFRNLPFYYESLVHLLDSKKMAYQGMALRKVVEDKELSGFPTGNYLVVGFNALSRGEQQLFKILRQNFNTEIVFEIDDYYYSDLMNEAGHFMRLNQKYYRDTATFIKQNGFQSAKTIEIHSVNGRYAQSQLVGEIISKLASAEGFRAESTAIILPEEGLLVPILGAIPAGIEAINVTMSYPVRNTALHGFMVDLLDLYVFASKSFNKIGIVQFHHESIRKIIRNQFFRSILDFQTKRILDEVQFNMARLNRISISYHDFINISEKEKSGNGLIELVFGLKELNAKSVAFQIIEILQIMRAMAFGSKPMNPTELESMSRILELFNRVSTYLHDFDNLDVKILKSVYSSLVNFDGIPFEGEPLRGLQIMGVLESRVIGFKNLIITSLNEGVYPAKKAYQTFLLPEIRKEYGIPMPSEEEATWAYYFYRLVSGADNVHLIYNTQPSDLESGEESRFIRQLRLEIIKKSPSTKLINSELIANPIIESKPDPVEISNSPESIERLLEIGSNPDGGFSPSSISMLMTCKRKFYYSKILKIKEISSVDEIVGANVRGNAIHRTLEDLYKPVLSNMALINEDFYDKCLDIFPEILLGKYKHEYGEGDVDHGKNYLMRMVDEQMIRNLLLSERQIGLKFQDMVLEKKLVTSFEIEINEAKNRIHFGGTADRIDEVDEVTRIIDYKSGGVDERNLSLKIGNQDDMQILFDGKKHEKAFQLLCYAWLLSRQDVGFLPMKTIIMALKTKSPAKVLVINGSEIIEESLLQSFGENLMMKIRDLFEPDFSYDLTEDEKNCEYCDFKDLCQR